MAQRSSGRNRRSQRRGPTSLVEERRGFSECLNPAAGVRAIHCNSVYIMRYRSMRVPVSARTVYSKADIRALVDSGATDNFINPKFVKRLGLGTKALEKPRRIWNIDNTSNKSGHITHYLDLDVQTKGIHKEMCFLLTDIGDEDILLGYPWLAMYEPSFSWRHGTIDEQSLPIVIQTVNPRIAKIGPVVAHLLTEAEKHNIARSLSEESCIASIATDLAIAAGVKKEVQIPKEYE